MNESWNPEIPLDLQQNFKKEKEQAFTLYLDFVVMRRHLCIPYFQQYIMQLHIF